MDQMSDSKVLSGDKETFSFGSESMRSNATLETIKDTVADKMHAAASAIQQKAAQNQENAIAGYAGQAAGWLDDAAEYVREVDPQKVTSPQPQPGHLLLAELGTRALPLNAHARSHLTLAAVYRLPTIRR